MDDDSDLFTRLMFTVYWLLVTGTGDVGIPSTQVISLSTTSWTY